MPIQLSGSLAITGSLTTSTTIGAQGAINITNATNPTSFTSTASFYTDGGVRVAKDMFVSGTAYFNNMTVYGTQSVQYITSSQLNIGTNLISVNTDTPAVRFGGLAVYDSGSTGLTGSMLWDSEQNHWVYSNPSGSSYSGGMLISGPRSSALGSEQGTTFNALMKGQGGDHITSSGVFESGSNVGIGTSTPITNLHIVNNTNVGLRLQATAVNGSSELDLLSHGTQNAFLDYGPNALRFRSTNADMSAINNGSVLVLENGGNVGIGTATPTQKLTVNGNISIISSSAFISLDGTGATNVPSGLGYGLFPHSSVGLGISSVVGISFWTDSTPTQKMRIAADGNVGIGTTNPTNILTVVGGASSPVALNLSNANANCDIIMTSGAGGGLVRLRNNLDDFQIHTNGSQRVTVTSSGNVGIGTTSPTGLLHILGTDPAFRIQNSGTGNMQFGQWDGTNNRIQSSGRDFLLTQTDSFNMLFHTNSTERMRITSGGNVGIGTTSPASTLDVNGQTTIRAMSGASLALVGDNTLNSPWGFTWYTPTYTGGVAAIRVARRGSADASDMMFFTSPNGDIPNERVRITSAGRLLVNTTSENDAIFQLHNNSSNYAAYIFANTIYAGSYRIMRWFANGNSIMDIGSGNGTDISFANNQNGFISLSTNAAERLRITSGGNVGIGITNPTYLLEMQGSAPRATIRATNSGSNVGYRFEGRDSGGTSKVAGIYLVPQTSTTSYLGLSADDSGYQMTIRADGNVGIGNTNPNERLDVSGNISIKTFMGDKIGFNTNDSFSGYGHSIAHYGISYGWSTNPMAVSGYYGIGFFTDGSEKMRIIGNGNVGIGTTNPLVRLHVGNGSQTAINGASNKIHIATTGTRSALLTLANSSGGTTVEGQFESSAESADLRIIIGSTSNHDVVLRTNNAERMRITNSGTVQPGANGTQDLGTASLRWATVFTSDLDMSNGIGDYTIVEGEEDLFLYNNKTNKVFKFLIQEVDPSIAPPKKIK